jgi:hypothetical protein
MENCRYLKFTFGKTAVGETMLQSSLKLLTVKHCLPSCETLKCNEALVNFETGRVMTCSKDKIKTSHWKQIQR